MCKSVGRVLIQLTHNSSLNPHKLVMVLYIYSLREVKTAMHRYVCDFSTWKAETEGSEIQDHFLVS